MTERLRIGLVLTGGGARAAYQVGVIRALARLPIDVTAISAVGAGALNGALIAASVSLPEAVERIDQLWSETVQAEEAAIRLGPLPVLRLGTYLTMLFAAGVSPELEERLKGSAKTAHRAYAARRDASRSMDSDDVLGQLIELAVEALNVSTDDELDQFVSGLFVVAAARPKRPFYVSVYETPEGMFEPYKRALELSGLAQAGAPRYVKISDPKLDAESRVRAVLASATLPFVATPTDLGGKRFVDGSFGGMKRSLGAVPLQPLRRDADAAIDAFLVVHTESGVTWSANDFKDRPIIEVRPSRVSAEVVGPLGYLWPDKRALEDWVTLGDKDTSSTFGGWLQTTGRWARGQSEHTRLAEAAKSLDD